MKKTIMQWAPAVMLFGTLAVASCTPPSSEKAGDQDTTATPVDTTQTAPADSITAQSVQDSAAVSK